MKKMDITKAIKYIGVNDMTIDLFESQYPVPNGISYNSYLIEDEKTVVMDTVDSRYTKEWIQKLKAQVKEKTIDYLVVSHVEPDHSGSIVELMNMYPEMILVGNTKTFVMLEQFFGYNLKEHAIVVKEGDTLSIGSHTLQFYMAPMVHWPEVMVTYEISEKILFSADAFGKFGSLEKSDDDWACEARRYYFNIVGKYGVPVQALLKKVAGLDISCICPLHGPILKDNLSYYINLYTIWSSYQPESKGVLVAYASIHGNTASAVREFAEILREKGEEQVVLVDLARADLSETIEDAFRYDRMVLAAASYDAGVFPCMQDFLHHLQAKSYQKRTVGIIENGSWAPSAAKTMRGILDTLKEVEVLEPIITIKSSLKEENRISMNELATQLIERGQKFPSHS